MLEAYHQFFSYPNLPKDVWLEIAKYVEPEDLGAMQIACQSFNILLTNTDVLWQPLLNRLHAIDTSVRTTPQEGKTIRQTFIEALAAVETRQQNEINFFRKAYSELVQIHFTQPADVKNQNKLSALEAIQDQLNAIHAKLKSVMKKPEFHLMNSRTTWCYDSREDEEVIKFEESNAENDQPKKKPRKK